MSNMSQKASPATKSSKNYFFNIDREAKKFYPKGHVSFSNNSGIPMYAKVRMPMSGMLTRGMSSSRFAII